jgi:hypothetical protein
MDMAEEHPSMWSEVEGMDTVGIHMVEVEGKDMMEEHLSKWR